MNYGWEVAQSVLYMPMASSMAQGLWRCFVASLGDGVLVLVILVVGWLVFRHLNWFGSPGFTGYLLMLTSEAVKKLFAGGSPIDHEYAILAP